jgi:ubiquinone biosynthesis protein COQ9
MALKDRILEAALMHAAFEGWTRRTLVDAAVDAEVDKATALRLFPQGGESLLAWLDDWADRKMVEALPPERLERLPIRRRVARLVRVRFEALGPHREALRRAALARLLPTHAMGGGQALWRTCDRIWQAVGLPASADTGFSHYSRRATLAGVLVSTFLFWLDDRSEDSTETWAFLDRRIEDVMRFGKLTSQVSAFLSVLPRPRAAR